MPLQGGGAGHLTRRVRPTSARVFPPRVSEGLARPLVNNGSREPWQAF
jgi:hypothetical protein